MIPNEWIELNWIERMNENIIIVIIITRQTKIFFVFLLVFRLRNTKRKNSVKWFIHNDETKRTFCVRRTFNQPTKKNKKQESRFSINVYTTHTRFLSLSLTAYHHHHHYYYLYQKRKTIIQLFFFLSRTKNLVCVYPWRLFSSSSLTFCILFCMLFSFFVVIRCSYLVVRCVCMYFVQLECFHSKHMNQQHSVQFFFVPKYILLLKFKRETHQCSIFQSATRVSFLLSKFFFVIFFRALKIVLTVATTTTEFCLLLFFSVNHSVCFTVCAVSVNFKSLFLCFDSCFFSLFVFFFGFEKWIESIDNRFIHHFFLLSLIFSKFIAQRVYYLKSIRYIVIYELPFRFYVCVLSSKLLRSLFMWMTLNNNEFFYPPLLFN